MSNIATDIAIVGMAGRFPGASSIDEFWSKLRDGVECFTRYSPDELRAAGVPERLLADPDYVPVGAPLEGMEWFDAGYFGFNPKEAAILDPQHRHFLEVAVEALEHAGHVPKGFPGLIGLFAGSGHNAYMPYNLLTHPDLVRSVGMFLLRHTGNDKDFMATRVSYLLDLRGPVLNIQTACSTSLVAVHVACQSLLAGECDLALAGGVTIELPHRQGYRYEDGEILSPDGHCRSFDASSAGTIFGSGAGAVVLRRLSDALADGDTIYAVIKGTAVNNDGSEKVGYLAPSVGGQARAITEALAVAGVEADSISYVEAHGTGTPVGDPIEVAALTQAFRQTTDRIGFCGIGSVKSNIGHLDTAAGVASLIKVVQGLRHEQIPASLHFQAPNPACGFESSPFRVVAERTPWPAVVGRPRRAGVSSLGVGGTNVHAVIEEAPRQPVESGDSGPQLFPLSAKTPAALDAAGTRLAAALEHGVEGTLADAAWTQQVGRMGHPLRRIAVGSTAAEVAAALRQTPEPAPSLEADRTVAFLFAGGGAQYPGMGADLYRREPRYRAAIDECLALLDPMLSSEVRRLLLDVVTGDTAAATQLERPSRALPALFMTQYACARLWEQWGVKPAAMIGHSMGEYTAALLAGVFELRDALALVTLRGRLFETIPEGGMLGVSLPEEELRARLGDQLSVAAVNAPGLSVASGPVPAIEALERRLAEEEIDAVRIRISVAAHSSMLEPILAEFGAFLRTLRLKAPTVPFVSNLSGTWITAAEAADPSYWVRHLRETVRFADGVREVLRDGKQVLLELGPGRTLATLARMQPDKKASHLFLTSLRHPDERADDSTTMLTALGKLWMAGLEPDWRGVHRGQGRRRIALPTYPFQRERYWIDPRPASAAVEEPGDPPGRQSDVGDWFWEPEWRVQPLGRTSPVVPRGSTLVIAGDHAIAARLAERLAVRGGSVVVASRGAALVEQGPGRWTVDPTDSSQLEQLLTAVGAGGPPIAEIVHLLTTDPSSNVGVEARLDRSVRSLIALGRALASQDGDQPLQLAVVGSGVLDLGGEGVDDLVKATVLGTTRVLPRELPHLTAAVIDLRLPPPGSPAERDTVERLVAELDRGLSDEVVAYRGGDRWVERFERRPRPGAQPPRLERGGRYLITGGLGGLGLEVARHLAHRYGARLALLARSPMPPRAEWGTTTAGPTGQRVRAVLDLEALGADVLVLTADAADPTQLGRAWEEAVHRWGGIDGVFHAAGVIDDQLLALKTPEQVNRVLAPKVAGTLNLITAFERQAPEFAVLFSSVSAFAGIAGQSDYAAANAFLDGAARHLSRVRGIPTVAVGWSAWREVGMVQGMAGSSGQPDAPPEAQPVDDYPWLERRWREGADTVFGGSLSADRHWLLGEHRVAGGDPLIPGTGYLELARAAGQRVLGTPVIELSDVGFAAPFAVSNGEARALRLRIEGPAGPSLEFAVLGRAAGETEWTEHVRGGIRGLERMESPSVDLSAVRARCGRRTLVRREDRLSAHLDFGPRWGNVREIAVGPGEALLTLELPAEFLADLEHHSLHPALLDMATAGAQQLIPGADLGTDFLVPLSYGRVRIHGPLGARVLSWIRLAPDSTRDSASFEVRVVDEAGRVLVEIEDFTMIRVRDRGQLGAHRDGLRHESPAADRAIAALLADAIRPEEGIEALERILGGDLPERVAVSPLPLEALLDRMRTPPPAAAPPVRPAEPAGSGRDLAPVEAALRTQEAVADAVVGERRDQSGELRLVAWVAFKPGEMATASELRRHLRDHLAEELVAQTFVEMDQIPRIGGQPDWTRLVSPFGEAESVVAPRTPSEQAIAEIWCELLGTTAVSVRDNFFDVGGHSLLSVRFVARLQKRVGVRLLHEHVVVHTLEQLAGMVDSMAPAGK